MAVIKLSLYVPNIDNVLTLFDTIRVWRSESGESGPYFLITADTAAAASILGTEASSFIVNGKTFIVAVDGGADQTVTFVTPDPVSVGFAVQEMNDQLTDITVTEESGALRVTSDTTGTDSLLEITGGSALTDLGFVLYALDNGEDAHILLQAGVDEYEYDDQSGNVSNWYKTQYYNSANGSFSTLSDPRQGDVGIIVPSANMITAQIDIADPSGVPVPDLTIIFHNIYSPSLEYAGYSILGKTIEVTTDQAGHAEIDLIKGMILDVIFAGTGITRRIQVPDLGTEFGLMDEVSVADDNYQIQIPDVPDAVRRS